MPKPNKITIGIYGEEEQGKSILLEEIHKTNHTKAELQSRIRLLISGHEYLKIFIND